MAHDFLGNELSIGDDVVFLNYNVTSASLERGKITKVSEHTAEINGKRRAEYKIVKANPVKPTMDNTWIPVSERPPVEKRWHLVYAPYYSGGSSSGLCNINGVMFAKWNGKHWSIEVGYHKRPGCVTHWQPLPEPPKGWRSNSSVSAMQITATDKPM